MRKVLVLGAGGYVGSVLCPKLVNMGFTTVGFDTFWYGHDTLPNTVWSIQGDIRDIGALKKALLGVDAVIHLACISNDPSFDLSPELGESINWTCFPKICEAVRDAGVRHFIYASSSSVYGIKEGVVTEDVECEPLTDYSKFKLKCEEHLKTCDMGNTTWTIVRPATVCGYSPRLRLDLVVNALTINALVKNKITVHGGSQKRPNIHIQDMARAYVDILCAGENLVHGQTFNVGARNESLRDLAYTVAATLGQKDLEIEFVSTNDLRSYHVNSDKISDILNFFPVHTISDAVLGIKSALHSNQIENPLENPLYYNVKRLNELKGTIQ